MKIRYRAYDKELNYIFNGREEAYDGMQYGFGNDDDMVDKLNETFGPQGFFSFLHDDRFDVMPYSGLNDDDGIEIYSGDIVEIQNSNETKTSYRSVVRIGPDGALVDAHPGHKSIGLDGPRQLSAFIDNGVGYQHHLKCRVVGNIYNLKEGDQYEIENNNMVISVTDLDHILGDYIIEESVPPSELFFKGLIDEMDFSGLDTEKLKGVDSVTIELRSWNKESISKILGG